MESVTASLAFIAGLASFLSPCVLPIIPGFLAYLAGSSLKEADKKRWQIFLSALFFVLGFSLVFSLLGVLLNSVLQSVAYNVQLWLSRVGGLLIILFGLMLTGLLRIPFLEREHKISVRAGVRSRHLTAFLFGAAFAAGWTPCVGPVLGVILALSATAPGSAFLLLSAYSLGLGLPFLFVGLFAAQASDIINRYAALFRVLNVLFGLMLIFLGILAFTQNLGLVANFEAINQYLLN